MIGGMIVGPGVWPEGDYMAAQMQTVKNLNELQPLFREFCEVHGLQDGDRYRDVDYIAWVSLLTLPDQLEIIRKYDPGFKFPGCSL